MGKRGPKPAGERRIPKTAKKGEVNPPEGMNARDRAMFRRIVDRMPAGHFRAPDVPLLREYCEAAGRSKDAQALLAKDGLVVDTPGGGKKAHPAVAIRTAAASVMAQIATKLRICPSSRTYRGGKGEVPDAPAQPPVSPRKGLLFHPGAKQGAS